MLDVEEQLQRLRARIAAIEGRGVREDAPPPKPRLVIPLEDCQTGGIVQTEAGQHFQSETLFRGAALHGTADVGALIELNSEPLRALGGEQMPQSRPERWAFLDTETTGLAGGSGTYAFLVAIGRITAAGFSVRQYFMRDYAEERSVLAAVRDDLRDFDVLITYNGRSYDQPLLESRYRMNRQRDPFSALPHLDLLYGARRLWKLRLQSCRLTELEAQILGFEREGDVPGELIPHLYFDYLRSGNAARLPGIFRHNALDVLSLACLTAIVPAAFGSPDGDSLHRIGVRKGQDLLGVARWLKTAGEIQPAISLFNRAINAGLPDELLFRTLWDLGCLQKKVKNLPESLRLFTELSECRNEFRVPALEELAKYYEHTERNLAQALDCTEQALRFERSDALVGRRDRLERKLSSQPMRKLAAF